MKGDGWRVAGVSARAFRSFGAGSAEFDVPAVGLVAITGPNGSGKSNLLEAICFAAGAAPSELRLQPAAGLRGVTCTDAGSTLPEVRLTVRRGRGRSAEQHVLEARLTPEGTRAYRIDGRIKTGAQVKAFLAERGIQLTSSTVIQQAQVTALSDNNSPAALAELVAGASGLSSWQLETAAARQEVARTRKALADISTSIRRMQAGLADDEAALAAAEEAARLEQQLEERLAELVDGLQAQQTRQQADLDSVQQRKRQLMALDTAAAEQLAQLEAQHRQLTTQQAAALAQLDEGRRDCGSTDAGSGSLLGRIAAAEAQQAALQGQEAARAQLEAQLCSKRSALAQREDRLALLQRVLQRKQQEAAQTAASLRAAQASRDAAAQAQETAKQAAASAVAAQRQEEAVAARRARLQELQDRLQQLEAAAAAAAAAAPGEGVAAAAAAASAAAAAADSQAQQLALAQQHAAKMRLELEVAEAAPSLALDSGAAAVLAAAGPGCAAAPLHSCFRLKQPPSSSSPASLSLGQLLTPLSAIAGASVLQVLVAPGVQQADQLLRAAAAAAPACGGRSHGSSSSKLKIWPLDQLRAPRLQEAAQRAAQQVLPPGAVTLPLDLLAPVQPAHAAALRRAFGALLIAADDATAGQLAERWGLGSVTLQGAVSRKGSLSGGYTGGAGGAARELWAAKLRADRAAAGLADSQQRVAAVQAQQRQLEAQRAAAEARLAAAEHREQLLSDLATLRSEAAAAAELLAQEQQHLADLQARRSTWEGRLALLQPGSGAPDAVTAGSGGTSGSAAAHKPAAVMQRAFNEDAAAARAAAASAEQQLDAVQEEVDELASSIEALQLRLAGPQADTQQRLQECAERLQLLRQQQAQQQAQLQQLQEEGKRLGRAVQEQKQEQKQLHAEAAAAAVGAETAAGRLAKTRQELRRVCQDFAGSDAVQALASSAAATGSTAPAGAEAAAGAAAGAAPARPAALSEQELAQLAKAVKQLHGRVARLAAQELPPGQQDACAARLARIAGFRQQADALQALASELEQRIANNTEQVQAANDTVFVDVAAGFSALCASLLPSLELQLVRTGRQAHEGLQVRFRRLQERDAPAAAAEAASGSDDGEGSGRSSAGGVKQHGWQASLGQLSGGQRTLVSLAMLLAVARVGCGCGLFLLDEVDAALDEANQARAAALLRQLANDSASACQVLAVTHNAAFQAACDGVLQVTRAPGGGSVPAGGAKQAGERPAGAAESRGAARGPAGKRGKSAGAKGRPAPAPAVAGGGSANKKARGDVAAGGAGAAATRGAKRVRFTSR